MTTTYSSALKIALISLLITGMAVFAVSCASDDAAEKEPVLAQVGEFEISQTHYLNELRRVNARAGYGLNVNQELMTAVLNSRLNRYVVVEYARNMEWDIEPEAVYMHQLIERKSVMEEFERRFIHDNVTISNDDLRTLFYRVNTSLRASHLFASSRAEADSLHRLLEEGRSFEALAREVFRQPRLAESGGDLGYFTVDDMDVAFEDAAYRMDIGEISKPVKTSHGYSIIKVTDIITTPVITESEFARKRNELQMIASEQHKELAVRRHMQQTINSFTFNEEAISALWDAVQNQPEAFFEFNPELNSVQLELHPELRNSELASNSGFSFMMADFLREAHFTPLSSRMRIRTKHQFRAQLDGMLYRALALSQAKSHPDYNAHYVQRTIEETFYNYLNELFDEYIDAQVEVSEELLAEEFRRNPDLYAEPLQIDISEIIVTSEASAEMAMQLLREGRSWDQVLHSHTADPAARETVGRVGFVPIQDFGMMAPSMASCQPGEYAGPFQITGNRFHIFKCNARMEPRQRSFAEAREEIRRVLHTEAKDELKMQTIREARDRFNAVVYTDRLMTIPQQL
ncbi:MAG: peptidylprolyl isomerase [Balneolales bacterium]|nr:peptidylprolyl isomerase [Balneolales bacterium]